MSGPNKPNFLVQNAIICVLFVAPFVASGYAAHAYSPWWLSLAAVWCTLLIVFFTYCPNDDEDNP